MKRILQKNISSEDDTRKFAKAFFEDYLVSEDNFVVFFEGGLGAGKTFLIREFLRLFGVKDKISSPTYIHMNEYTGNSGKNFAHFDFYRFDEPELFFAKGFDEVADDKDVSCFVEWSDKIPASAVRSFSGKVFRINIKHGESVGMRKILVYG